MNVDVVSDILEMLSYALAYRYLTNCDAKALHERNSIVVSTVGSTKARHGNTNNALTVVAQLVECEAVCGTGLGAECLNANQQRKSRVQASAYAKYYTL